MKLRNLFFAVLAAVTIIGCTKVEPEQPLKPEISDYTGTVTVTFQGSDFDNENIAVNFTPSQDGTTASITIYKIRFVPQMPVTIDVTIPDIKLSSTTDKITLECEKVVPIAMGGEYPKYTVTDLKGEISGSTMSFSLNFGDFPTRFSGTLNKQ